MTVKDSRDTIYVGIDVGGTNIKTGLVTGDGRSLGKVSVKTEAEQGPEVGLNNIIRSVELALERTELTLADVHAVGLATPGTMDIPAGKLVNPPNLPGWIDVPIRQLVADRLGKQTVLQNDANAAGYGEFWVGAAREAESAVLWTLGTGIGCAIVIGDLIIEGRHSHGAESGHMIIQMKDGRYLEGTGMYGTVEAYAGAKAVVRRAEELLEESNCPSLLREWMSNGRELTPLLVSIAAEQDDELSMQVVLETAEVMAVATVNLMHTIDPDLVLLGGAMTFGQSKTNTGRCFLQRVRDEVKKLALPVPAERTRIEFADLGGDAGFIGAAGCARLKFGARV